MVAKMAPDIAVWLSTRHAHHVIETRLEHALKETDLPPLAWHELLMELRRCDPKGMRPAALERRLSIPQYALSRLLKRVADAGLIERRPLPGDRRAIEVLLTDDGRKMCHRAWPIFRAALLSSIGLTLKDDDAQNLQGLLKEVAGAS